MKHDSSWHFNGFLHRVMTLQLGATALSHCAHNKGGAILFDKNSLVETGITAHLSTVNIGDTIALHGCRRQADDLKMSLVLSSALTLLPPAFDFFLRYLLDLL